MCVNRRRRFSTNFMTSAVGRPVGGGASRICRKTCGKFGKSANCLLDRCGGIILLRTLLRLLLEILIRILIRILIVIRILIRILIEKRVVYESNCVWNAQRGYR